VAEKGTLSAFRVVDRVELLLFYSFHGEPRPQGIVVGTGLHCVKCKMDRNGKVVRLDPSDVRIIEKSALGGRVRRAHKKQALN
jgi:hypothetical protein